MPEKDKTNEKLVSKTFIGIGLLSAGFGAFHGFYDGEGIPLPLDSLKYYLTYSPAIIQSLLGIYDGISIAKTGKQTTGNYPDCMVGELEKTICAPQEEKELINHTLYGAIMGGIGEGIGGAVETLLGYFIGFTAGRITKILS